MRLTPQSPLRDVISAFLGQVEVLVHQRQRAPGTLRTLRTDLWRVAPELNPERRPVPWASLGGVPLELLDVSAICEWHEDVQLGATDASACQSLARLRAVLYWARRRGLLQQNPAAHLGLRHSPRPGEPLVPEELAHLHSALDVLEQLSVAHFRRHRRPLAAVGAASACRSIRLLEVTGARLAEVAELQIVEVHLERRCILRRHCKTGPRAIALGGEAVELLSRQLEAVAGRGEHVFPSPLRAGASVSCRSVEVTFRRAAALVGLDRHVHDLRHTFAWLALASGTSIEALALTLGHRSVETTRRVYGRHNVLTPEALRVAERVERARLLRILGEVDDVAA